MFDFFIYHSIKSCATSITRFAQHSHSDDVTVIGTYEQLQPLLNYIVKNTDYLLDNLEFARSDVNGYGDEYGMILGADGTIWIQPAVYIQDGGVKKPVFFNTFVFAYAGVNPAILDLNPNAVVFTIDDGCGCGHSAGSCCHDDWCCGDNCDSVENSDCSDAVTNIHDLSIDDIIVVLHSLLFD